MIHGFRISQIAQIKKAGRYSPVFRRAVVSSWLHFLSAKDSDQPQRHNGTTPEQEPAPILQICAIREIRGSHHLESADCLALPNAVGDASRAKRLTRSVLNAGRMSTPIRIAAGAAAASGIRAFLTNQAGRYNMANIQIAVRSATETKRRDMA